MGCLLEFLGLWLDFNIKTFSIKWLLLRKFWIISTDIFSSYKCWFDDVLINWIWTKLSVRSRDRWKGLIVFFDNTLKNSWGLMVSCRKFRRVSIVWLLGLGVHGCWWGYGVLQPFGQRCLRPSLACFHQLPYSRAYSILDYIRRLVFKYFWGLVLKPRDLV